MCDTEVQCFIDKIKSYLSTFPELNEDFKDLLLNNLEEVSGGIDTLKKPNHKLIIIKAQCA